MYRKSILTTLVISIVMACCGIAQATPTANVTINYGSGSNFGFSPWDKSQKPAKYTLVYDSASESFVPCSRDCPTIKTLHKRLKKHARPSVFESFKPNKHQQVLYGLLTYIDRTGNFTYNVENWKGRAVPNSIRVTVNGFPQQMRLANAYLEISDSSLPAGPPLGSKGGAG